ncbi:MULTISPECIES: sensor domain-containing diguanylate cyclase [unclassified Pseudomonas]|jgi:diguanylate cyclase (GGDEF)-like protein|uniref:sensor domain-containing diguanylate cyclase n=1 Tax=unclassified Pseudomonas TaxID=196821 RepID=UPI000C86CF2C|nr:MULTISPECIES: sensor domain-containing diguanylate cyclase [unclassified Pseudomonas]MDI1330657.1 sensor domain-containing diguanylate cyclase [Pseudomonas sp.]PMV84605.1 GGDEF domain-containing protein [Pseudomonas sp. GW101-1A09]PMV90613.1 GGDEF domain-containing protein [Pseudomonas sp. GW460-C8]PMV93464.1 GGDEF domain-containing protein [Pseudomonas sp. FW306-2-2C-B10A]PMV97332.1 GGDEF domain-containing protein [Pseudomonas sp. MPR-TSA4]
MPLHSPLYSQRSLVLTLIALLGAGFLATSFLSYYASRASIRDSIVNTELPLTSDTVYSEIQKDLVRPILISSMMSRDTFMRDWVVNGEQDAEKMTRYLNEVMTHYGAYTAFFVSNTSLTYYHAKGVLKQVKSTEPRDAWYFRVRDMADPYEINVDPDLANKDNLTFFINYKVYDYNNRFIGAAGVGLTVDAVIKLIDKYQQRYQRSVYFVDNFGRLVLTGAEGGPQGAHIGQKLGDLDYMKDLVSQLPKPHSGSYEYSVQGQGHFLNVRFIPELNWYLFVDKREDGALSEIRQSLYLNLLICLLVTLIVLLLLNRVIKRYQGKIQAQATLDSLTELPNRRGFDLLAAQAMLEARREPKPLTAMLLDLDHFKVLNDTYGHLAGDQVLIGFARDLESCLRHSDIVCRWGGEEFIVLLKDTDGETGLMIAEKIRQHVEQQRYAYDGKELQLTVSIGLTTLQVDETLHTLLSRADHAMYRAKQAGRNRTCVELPHSSYE